MFDCRFMGTMVVLALLAADGRAITPEARAAPRMHGGVGLVFTGGIAQFTAGFGPGPTVEVGVTLEDTVTVSLRSWLGALEGLAAATLGPTVDWALSDRWSIGTGLVLGYLGAFFAFDLPSAVTIQVPVRAQLALGTRSPEVLSRRGFKLFFEAGPGVVLSGTAGQIPRTAPLERWSVMGALGALYAW